VARRWFAIAAAARYSLEAARIDDGLISGVTPMLSTRRLAQMQFEVAAERLIDEAISLRQQVGVHPLGSSKVDRGHVAGSIASPMTRVLASPRCPRPAGRCWSKSELRQQPPCRSSWFTFGCWTKARMFWRPARETALPDGTFRLLEPNGCDRNSERWEFPPSTNVRCFTRRVHVRWRGSRRGRTRRVSHCALTHRCAPPGRTTHRVDQARGISPSQVYIANEH